MNAKQLCEPYLAELKAEAVATRKCLERIPESVYKFKPHERSMEMGYLTLLVADIPRWITAVVKASLVDFETFEQFPLSTTAALLKHYDENLKGAEDALSTITDESFKKAFELRRGKTLLMSQTKPEAISSTLNHWVHHRGQLTVYMRLNDIAVPSIYGPSADEKTF